MIEIINISSYKDYEYNKLLNECEKKLLYYDYISIVSDIDEINETISLLKENNDSIKTFEAMVKIADLLVQYGMRHEAFYFYHKAWINTKIIQNSTKYISHDSLLQMAKILYVGKISLNGTQYESNNKEKAKEIFEYLIFHYNSAEAKIYL